MKEVNGREEVGGRRKWKIGRWEERGNGRDNGGRKEEVKERIVGGRRKWNRGWWEEAGNGREDVGRKQEMEEMMVGGRRKWKKGWWDEGGNGILDGANEVMVKRWKRDEGG